MLNIKLALRFQTVLLYPKRLNSLLSDKSLTEINKIMKITEQETCFGLIVGTRVFFNSALAAEGRKDLVELMEKQGYGYGPIPAHVAKESIIKQATFGVATERWINANEIDAAAFQCRTSFQENHGCATWLTMSMLSEKLLPSACEVDICGTLLMYALSLASGNPAALLDWNNNFGNERNKCSGIHCSNYPKSFFKNKTEIERVTAGRKSSGQHYSG